MASPASASSTALLAGSTFGAPYGRASGQPPSALLGATPALGVARALVAGAPTAGRAAAASVAPTTPRAAPTTPTPQAAARTRALRAPPRALLLARAPVRPGPRSSTRGPGRSPCIPVRGRPSPLLVLLHPPAGAGRPAARHAGSAAGHAGALPLGRAAPLLRRRPAAVLLRVGPSTAGPSTWIGQPHHRPSIVLGSAVSRVDFQHHDAAAATSDRLVLRLRCYLAYDLSPLHSFSYFIHAVPFSFINCRWRRFLTTRHCYWLHVSFWTFDS